MPTELDAGNLNNDGGDEDDKEQGVVKEVGEDIDFSWFEFSSVDLIEDLHKNEGVEENAVMFTRLDCPLFHSDRRLDSEQLRA